MTNEQIATIIDALRQYVRIGELNGSTRDRAIALRTEAAETAQRLRAAPRTPAEGVEPTAWHCPACEAAVVVDDPTPAAIERLAPFTPGQKGAPVAWDCADDECRKHAYQQMTVEIAHLRAQVEDMEARLMQAEDGGCAADVLGLYRAIRREVFARRSQSHSSTVRTANE